MAMIPPSGPWVMLGTVLALTFLLGIIFGTIRGRPADHSGSGRIALPLILALLASGLVAVAWVLEPSWLHGRTAWRIELGLALVAAYAAGTVPVRMVQRRSRARA